MTQWCVIVVQMLWRLFIKASELLENLNHFLRERVSMYRHVFFVINVFIKKGRYDIKRGMAIIFKCYIILLNLLFININTNRKFVLVCFSIKTCFIHSSEQNIYSFHCIRHFSNPSLRAIRRITILMCHHFEKLYKWNYAAFTASYSIRVIE